MDSSLQPQSGLIDISAPIEPGVGLGGLQLRMPAEVLDPIVSQLPERTQGMAGWARVCRTYPLWEVRYLLGPVSVGIDIRTGKIFRLVAETGYRGTLPNGIGVGMSVRVAVTMEPRLYYDEPTVLVLIRGCPEVALQLPEDLGADPNVNDLTDLMDQTVVAIQVYDWSVMQ